MCPLKTLVYGLRSSEVLLSVTMMLDAWRRWFRVFQECMFLWGPTISQIWRMMKISWRWIVFGWTQWRIGGWEVLWMYRDPHGLPCFQTFQADVMSYNFATLHSWAIRFIAEVDTPYMTWPEVWRIGECELRTLTWMGHVGSSVRRFDLR